MTIDFSQIPEQVVANFKGGEKELHKRAFSDGSVIIMLDRLVPGASIGVHTHADDCEIIYVLSGTATFFTPGGEETVPAGQSHYCPKGGTHGLKNNGPDDLVFFAVVPKQ